MVMDLVPGQPYFVYVEACNGVLLCSTAVSYQLVADDSPPIPGIVFVGMGDGHEYYQPNR